MQYLGYLLILLPFFSISQSNHSSIILNEQKKPIKFANVSINQTESGTSTNEKGEFYIENVKFTDSLKISSIGYESKLIAVKDLKDQIILTSSSIKIKEVTIVKKRKNKSFSIGYYKMRSFLPYKSSSTINIKLATFIPYESTPAIIEKVLIPISNAIDTCELKLYLYEATEYGKPGKEIYAKTLLLSETRNKLDISKENIQIPYGGIFVGVEWLFEPFKVEDLNNKNEINSRYAFSLKMTPSIDSTSTYQYWRDQWKLWKNNSNEYRNVRFGLILKHL